MFRAYYDEQGFLTAINRISDGATVDRSKPNNPITQEFNAWLPQNPGFDMSNRPISAAALSMLRDVKKAELKAAANRAIQVGFTSSGLTTAYTYTARTIDQVNITTAATISTLKKLATQLSCTNASGVKAMRGHTQDQAQTVLRDLILAREAAQTKYRTLAAQVDAATTAAQISAIVWA